jgi:bifunctional DNase/RNase
MAIAAAPQPIELRVADVQPVPSQPGNPLYAAILEELGGTRRVRIVMQKPGADAIALHLQALPTSRPLTYAFMADLLQALGGRLLEVRITRTDGQTIYATAVVESALGTHTLDARPSDAINLALRLGAPIRVEPATFAALPSADDPWPTPGVQWV